MKKATIVKVCFLSSILTAATQSLNLGLEGSSSSQRYAFNSNCTFLLADRLEPAPSARNLADGPEPVPPVSFMIADGPEPVPPAVLVADGPEPVPPARTRTDGPEPVPLFSFMIADSPEPVPPAVLVADGPEPVPPTEFAA
jgi:hypothetical protein